MASSVSICRICDIKLIYPSVTTFAISNYSTEYDSDKVVKKVNEPKSLDATTFSNLVVKKIPEPELHSLRRGTGGRSSFNGNICTVFGATGFSGRHVLNRLGKVGTQVIVPYRCAQGYTMHLKPSGDLGQVLFHPFNLRDEDSIRKAVARSNVVVNLIGRHWKTWNYSLFEVNVTGAEKIARICREMGVRKLIHFSALNCCEKPRPVVLPAGSEFLRTKWLGEQKVREQFPEAVIFRPSDMWGEEDNFLRYYASGFRLFTHTLWLVRKGEGVIKQPVDVANVAQAVVQAINDPDSPGRIYQCVGPHRYHLPEFCDWYFAVLRKNAPDWGYRRRDARWNPLFYAYLSIIDFLFLTKPEGTQMCWERFEREHITDVVNPALYTLKDLGIELTKLEDVVVSLMFWMRAFAYYDEQPHEFIDPPNPPIVHDM